MSGHRKLAGQIPNSGHELAIYVHTMTIVKLCWHNFKQIACFIDLSLLKEFSGNVGF